MIVPATVSSEIVVRVDDLPAGQADLLKAALTFRNEDRDKAEKIRTWGWWDLPETISLWREEKRRGGEHVLCLPRGFASQLVAGLAGAGATVEWNDQRSSALAAPGYFKPFLLRWYQAPFVADLMRAQQGIGEAPTSSGKTVSALAMMALLQQRALVIVDKAALLDQWRERAAEFLGLSLDLKDERSVGMIGQDVWVERDLTICLRQTLSSRQWQTDAIEWGRRYGLCIADEVHHAGSAETLQEVVRALPCMYFFGLSATPARTETQGKIIAAIIGPIVARIDNQALVDEGIVVEPVVRVIKTDFTMDFWPTHDSAADGKCQKPSCTKKTQHSHKDNWEPTLKALIGNKDRNTMIAETIASERGHVHLVFARRKAHLTAIRQALEDAGWDGPIYDLTGKQNADGESQEISRAIKEGGFWELDAAHKKATKEIRYKKVSDSPSGLREAVILSTVADEGVDIPPIDRVHVVYPLRQQLATIQLIGRGTRSAPGKSSCAIVDYHDAGCSVLDEQHLERMRTYRSQGLKIESKNFERPPLTTGGEDGQAANDQESAPSGLSERDVACSTNHGHEVVVLICGSRGWGDRPMIERYVKNLIGEANWDRHLVVIHGGARGADTIAGEVAAELGVEVRVFEADWERGKSAGSVRNIEMLDQKPDRVGAFSLGTSGTRHTVDQARKRGIPVDLHGPKGLVKAS